MTFHLVVMWYTAGTNEGDIPRQCHQLREPPLQAARFGDALIAALPLQIKGLSHSLTMKRRQIYQKLE